MSRARMKTVFLHFSNYLPWSIFFIAAAVRKPGFPGISTFLVVLSMSQKFQSIVKTVKDWLFPNLELEFFNLWFYSIVYSNLDLKVKP